MKCCLIRMAFVFFLGSFSVSANAADRINISPEEPEAYMPFYIEFLVSDDATSFDNNSISVEIENNTVFVDHIGDGLNFLTPVTYLKTEIQGLPPGEYTVVTSRRQGDGDVVEENEHVFSILESPPTEPVFSLFHPEANHYFITASESERALSLEQGWRPVDAGFNVWPADGPAPETAVPVCRFYSPLSHSYFYTGNMQECEYLQSFESGWEYEDIAFQALHPSGGACPSGTTPVWRLYNNRYAEKDSNHRFVASKETYRSMSMVAEGWLGGGIAFCSPP